MFHRHNNNSNNNNSNNNNSNNNNNINDNNNNIKDIALSENSVLKMTIDKVGNKEVIMTLLPELEVDWSI